MNRERIDRINELARIAKIRTLSAEEAAERELLRRAYIDEFKANLRSQLETITLEDEQGNLSRLADKRKK
ncbi:MAG: DUF896 domain-containing protein [Eubacteriales bacterium]|nr:DUF896 domain-containing protein [Eubacteriales bacterium]